MRGMRAKRLAHKPGSLPTASKLLERLRKLHSRARKPKGSRHRAQAVDPAPSEAALRGLARETLDSARSQASLRGISPLVLELWDSGDAAARQLAILLLEVFENQFDAATWRLADAWVEDLDSPALTDRLASAILAPLLVDDRSHLAALIGWARAPSMWRRRAALETLHRLSLIRNAFIPETLALAHILARDRASPVQESLGRALNRCARLAPSAVRQFLLLHRSELAEPVRQQATAGLPTSGL